MQKVKSEIEPDVLKGCKKGKLKYQEVLYSQFYGYGLSIALRYSYSREEALEILNDAFLKVFNNIKKFDNNKSFKSWFRRILINTSIDYFRKNKKLLYLENIDYTKVEVFNENDINSLEVQDLLKLLNSLPEMLRLTFNLYEIEGYKHDEIAEMLKIKASTSRANLTRAKKMLRNLFQKHHDINYANAI